MDNDEINRRVAEIMEAMPEPPTQDEIALQGLVFSSTFVWIWDEDDDPPHHWQPLDFCHDIAAAWRCVEWAKERGTRVTVTVKGDTWRAEIYGDEGKSLYGFFSDTAPMAICLAFLAAFGGE